MNLLAVLKECNGPYSTNSTVLFSLQIHPGLPKPAICNQTKGMAVSKMFLLFDYSADDTVYVVTPMYHSAAIHLGFFNTIDAGRDDCER